MRAVPLFLAALFLALPAAAVDFNEPRSLVDASLANHPTLARLGAELAAARERVSPAGAQPNPMLMAGVQNKNIDLTDDEMMTMYMLGASQTIVGSGKRDAARSAARLAATSVERQIDSVRAEIERDVIFAYYDLAAVDSQLAAAESVRQLIDAIVDAARVRYEVGAAAQADVIRGQLQKSDLDHQIVALRGSRAAAAARLLAEAGLPQTTEVPRIELSRSTAALDVDGSLEVPATHPGFEALRSEVEVQEQQIRLARLARRPDVNIEAQYGYRRMERDMFSVVASVELPIRDEQVIEPQVREAILRRDAAQRRIDELRRTLVRDLALASAAHATANSQLDLHEQVLVPQARLAFESTLAAYQSGRSTLDAALAAETTYLRLQLDYYDYLAQHIKAIRDFEAIRSGARFGATGGASAAVSSSSGAAAPAAAPMGGM